MGKGIRLFIITLALFSCSTDEDIILIQEPTLELDGRLPMDSNGYYLLELNDSSHQTIHTVSGTVGNTLYWDEPMKVDWESNLTWYLQDEFEVSTSNQSSYVVNGKVMNVIAPIKVPMLISIKLLFDIKLGMPILNDSGS